MTLIAGVFCLTSNWEEVAAQAKKRSEVPLPYTLNPKPKTLNPTPYTLNPKPYTPNPKP